MDKFQNTPKEEVAEVPSSTSTKRLRSKEAELNYWLLSNIKIMEELTVNEPVCWHESDYNG